MARVYGNNAARGYDRTHWQLRAQWKPMVDAGQVQCHADPCLEERDGRSRWIAPGAPWHLGHTPDRTGWTGPEHQRCGAADGARRGNQNRPRNIVAALGPGRSPVCKTCGKEYHYAAKQCQICGMHYHPSRGVQYTCSRRCGAIYQRMGRPVAAPASCEVCGKPRPQGNRHTCSQRCADKLRARQQTERTCGWCGKKFVAESREHCSVKCRSSAYYAANRDAVIAQQLDRYYAKQGRERPGATASVARRTGMMERHSRAW